jgi:putative tricarboxylic transport membrane protein
MSDRTPSADPAERQNPARAAIRVAPGELAIALGVIVLALLTLWQTQEIPVSPLYARVGPTVGPTLAWIGLLGLGLGLLFQAIRGGWQTEEEKEVVQDWPAFAWVAFGLLLNVTLIGPLGFTLASTLMFACIARGFGSRRLLRDLGFGLILAVFAYFGFARGLGIDIGRGYVEAAILGLIGQGG